MRDVQEQGSFSVLKRKLLMREGVESNPGPPSIGQTLDWYTGALNKGTFFNLSDGNELKDKKLFKKALESLVRANIKTQQNILREGRKGQKL